MPSDHEPARDGFATDTSPASGEVTTTRTALEERRAETREPLTQDEQLAYDALLRYYAQHGVPPTLRQ